MGQLIVWMLVACVVFWYARWIYRSVAPSEVAKRKERWGNFGKWLRGLSSYDDHRH